MKKFIHALKIFVTIGASASSLQSMVFYAQLISPKGERLQIMGDHHALAEDYAYPAVDALIKVAKGLGLPKQLPIALELPDRYLKDSHLKDFETLAPTFRRFITHQDDPSCKLIAVEPRGHVSDIVEGLFSWIEQVVDQFALCNRQEELLELQQALKATIENYQKMLVKSPIKSLSCSDILASYQAMLADMKMYEGLYRATTLAPLIENATKKFEQALEELKRFAGKHEYFDTAFFAQVAQCKTVGAFRDKYMYLHAMMRRDTDWLYADFAFLKKMLDIFEQGYTSALLTIGVIHAEKLIPLFANLGWRVEKQVSTIKKIGDYTNITMSDAFIMDFVAATHRFLRAPQCEQCSKKENLKTCSACKKVYYCGPDCQKAGWPTHKGDCKKK